MRQTRFLGVDLLDESIDSVVASIYADRSFPPSCKVLVTPNVDHFSRLYGDERDEAFCNAYNTAIAVCDSRVVKLLSKILGGEIRNVVPGSDLTKCLLGLDWFVSSKICVIGGEASALNLVFSKYGMRNVVHYNPPMGFIDIPDEVERSISFVLNSGAEYVFLAVGSPRQELLASRIKERFSLEGTIRFIFCVGASFDFLSGKANRAPSWMRMLSLEWLHRAFSEPKRMIPRYYKNFIWICRLLSGRM